MWVVDQVRGPLYHPRELEVNVTFSLKLRLNDGNFPRFPAFALGDDCP
jgi:hypothetical protein